MIITVQLASMSKACAAVRCAMFRFPVLERATGMSIHIETERTIQSTICDGRMFSVIQDELYEAVALACGMSESRIAFRKQYEGFVCEHAIEIGD
jgi:hypothetical protein